MIVSPERFSVVAVENTISENPSQQLFLLRVNAESWPTEQLVAPPQSVDVFKLFIPGVGIAGPGSHHFSGFAFAEIFFLISLSPYSPLP